MSLRHWVLLAFISLLWGGSFFFNAILIQSVGPWTLTAGRVTIGATGVAVYAAMQGLHIPKDGKRWLFYLLLGAISYALPFTAIAWGQQQITGGVASIINALNPMTMLVVTHYWPGGEQATRLKFLGILIGICGVVILTLPKIRAGAVAEVFAYLAVFSASILYATGLNLVRKLKHDPPVLTALGSLSGAAIISIIMACFIEGVPQKFDQNVVLAFLGIGLVSTSLAFSIMYYLLPKVGPVNFSMVTFMVPISAILLGTSFLDEKIEAQQLLGMVVIFFGLLFIDGRFLSRFSSQNKSNKTD